MSATGPTARQQRLMATGSKSLPFFESPIQPGVVIRLETGQDEEGIYSWFIRVWRGGIPTYQESWHRRARGFERFEKVVENHVEGRSLGV